MRKSLLGGDVNDLISLMRLASAIYAEAERAIERNDMAIFKAKLAEAKELLNGGGDHGKRWNVV